MLTSLHIFTPHETTLWKNVANKYIQGTQPQTLLKLQTPSATIQPTIKTRDYFFLSTLKGHGAKYRSRNDCFADCVSRV